MRIKVKKAVEAPTNIKEAVDRISSTAFQDFTSVLRDFKWTFDKGDINHWVPVLDHFDSFLEEYVSKRADVQLKVGEEGVSEDPPFQTESVLAVLGATCTILENCSNKGAYNSSEHLTSLLAAPALEVTAAALQVLQVLMRKTHHTSVRLAVSAGLTQRLLSLCKGWGGKEEGLDLVVCASGHEADIQKVLHKATTLHFEFTPDSTPDGADTADMEVQPVTLHVPNVDRFTEPEHAILAELVRRYKVPAAARFDLLCRIRIARNFGTLAGRRQLVRQRLLAFNVLLQCSPSAEEYNSLYLSEPEIVSELVGLVQAEEAVEQEELRTLALKALAAQLQDRSRSTSVITAVTSGGQSGLLAMLLHKSVASILQQANVPLAPSGSGVLPGHVVEAAQAGAASSSSSPAAAPIAAAAAAPAQGSVQYSVSFVDALLTLVAALVTSSSGCQALNDAGVISALLPLLRDHHSDHLNLVCTSLKILEMYMDLSQTASTTFRDLGGLTEVIKRLAHEVGAAPSTLPTSAAGTATSGDGDVDMTAADQSAGQSSTAANSGQAAGQQPAVKQLPHNRKTLLKILLRIITISSYQPTGNLSATRPVDDDAQLLYASLKAMYARAEEFGGTLFTHAVQVMTDLIHHEPQSFRQLQEAGLPDAFLTAVKAGVFPSGEAICAFPNALVALCLNSVGLKRVRETAALNVLVDVFMSKKAMRVLTGDNPSVLGSGLEELMRFVPSLRSDGVNVVLGVFKALCVLGGDTDEAAEASKPLPPEAPAPEQPAPEQPAEQAVQEEAAPPGTSDGAVAGSPAPPAAAQPMETDTAAGSSAPTTPTAAAEQPAAAPAEPAAGTEPPPVGMDVDTQAQQPAAPAEPDQPAAAAATAEAPPAPAPAPGPAPAAAAAAAAAQTAAQQERELERQRLRAEDARLSAIAERVLAETLQQVAAKKDQETDVEAFLPVALTAASRMLEPLLANAETSRLFVERGGADLLLKIYKLPKLTTVFNFSSASHSLLSVFRALSGAHGSAIAAKSKEAVAQQLALLLPMAEQIGPVCVPTLLADVRDKYAKQVLVVQGLVALTSAVARNVTAMLPQVSMGDPPLLASMGKLERIVMAQAAASDPWKQARDAAKRAAAAAEATGTAASASGGAEAGTGETAATAADGGDNDEDGAAGIDEDMEGAAAEQAVDRAAPEQAAGAAVAAGGATLNGKQKRTPEDTSYDALSYLLTSLRTFYMGTAKAIHTPVRRREEALTAPTAPMKAAALNLALLLVGNLQLRPWQQQQQQQPGQEEIAEPSTAETPTADSSNSPGSLQQKLDEAVAAVRGRSGHLLRVVEELNQVLFDSRRHYCHLLVLNYFSALGGMQVYATTFNEAADLLWNLLDLQEAARSEQQVPSRPSEDQAMLDVQPSSSTPAVRTEQQAAQGAAGPAATAGNAGTKDPKQILEAVLVKMLSIYEQLANATVLLSAPQATQMLLAALPNYAGQPLVPPAKDALQFVQQLHSQILSAVLPLWSHPKVAAAPPGVLTAIIRVLQTCSQGPGHASLILRYSQRHPAARVQAAPDPQMVQQIVDMGFTQARAEEALRRVGANSVELAMEWLITHPEEPAAPAAAQAAGAAAAGTAETGAAAAADAATTEEEELTRALLASLSVVGMSPDSVAQRSQQPAAVAIDAAGGAAESPEQEEAVTPQSTPRPVVQPGAPVLGAVAAAAAVVGTAVELPSAAVSSAAGIPSPTQLVDGAIRLIAASPATAFSIADLVLTIAQREEGKDRQALLERLMNDCLPPAADAASTSAAAAEHAPVNADILTPARLLLLVLHKDMTSRKVAADKGIVDRCLTALESWQATYTSAVQAFEKLDGQQQLDEQETKKLEVPVWVEAMFMLLDLMTTTQLKPSSRESAAARAAREAARVTAGATAAGERTAAAAVEGAAPAATDATAQAAAEQAPGEDVQMADQPAAAAPAAPTAAETSTAVPAAEAGVVRGPSDPPQLAGLTEALANWKPCGMLDEQQQQRATTVALTLLQQLYAHADQWDKPNTSMYAADGSVPNPGSATTVVLQLLSHLTKRYSNAQQVLAAGAHQLLLSLPAACLAPSISRQEGHIGSILRHLLEDPVTLEAWMESEIKNSMSVKGVRDPYMNPRYYGQANPSSRYTTAASFLTLLASLVSRDPAVFLQAVGRTCALETARGETMVRLKTARELQQPQQQQQQQQVGTVPVPASREPSTAGAASAAGEPAAEAAAVAPTTPAPPATAPRREGASEAATPAAAAPCSREGTAGGTSERAITKSTSKASRKLVPGTFVDVVDALLDVVLSYKGVKAASASEQHQQTSTAEAASMEVDAASASATVTPAGPVPAPAAQAAAPSSQDVTPLPADLLLRKLNPVAREVGIQTMVLRLLADYCLLYNNTVGWLLKRDSECFSADVRASLLHHHQAATAQQVPAQEGSKSATKSRSGRHSIGGGSTGRSSMPGSAAGGQHMQESHKAGVVLKHIMHVQLVDRPPEGAQAGASVAANASALLQAVCIRSGEGRRRIMSEVVNTIAAGAGGATKGLKPAGKPDPKLPYICSPGGPEPLKVSAFVSLMGALVQSGSSSGMPRTDPRQSAGGSSMSLELLRAMREAGAVKALAQVLKLVNMDHAKAKDAINAVLKPLEVLTRPLPKQPQPVEDARATQQTRQQQTATRTAAAAAAPARPRVAGAANAAAADAAQPVTAAAAAAVPAAEQAAAAASSAAGAAAGRSSGESGGRAAMDEDQRPQVGEEAAGPDALAAAGRFVGGGAGQAPGQLPGGLIDQIMDQLVDIEVELDAGGPDDDDDDDDGSSDMDGSSDNDDDSSHEGSGDTDEDMAEGAEHAPGLQGAGVGGVSDEGGMGDAPSLTEGEESSEEEGPHAELVLGDGGFIAAGAAGGAAGNGPAGGEMSTDMGSDSEGEPESDDDDEHNHHHHHHAFEDELLHEDDLPMLPPQIEGAHHVQEDGVVDPLDDEEEEDEYLDDDDDDEHSEDEDAGRGFDMDVPELLDVGGRFSWDVPMPGELDDMPAALMMQGGFGRAAARRILYRPGASAATAGVWDDSEPTEPSQDALNGTATVQMLLSQFGINAGGGSVAMIGPNGRQYRVAMLTPEGTELANGSTGSEAVAGAMNSALYSLSTQLLPQQHRLLALPPRVPVTDSTALLESAGAAPPPTGPPAEAAAAGAASGLRSQASSVNALTRLLARAPEGAAAPSYIRDGARARLTAQRQGNLFSVALNPTGMPGTLGTAANLLQSLEMLGPGGMLGGPPGAGALADLDNTVWDEAVNQLLEALAPQGVGRGRTAAGAAPGAARSGATAEEAGIDPRSLESQMIALLRAQAPQQPQQQPAAQQPQPPQQQGVPGQAAGAQVEAAQAAHPAAAPAVDGAAEQEAQQPSAAGAAPPGRRALTEEAIAAAFQAAMQDDQPVAAEPTAPAQQPAAANVPQQTQQQEQAPAATGISSHPVDVPPSAPDSPTAGSAGGSAAAADQPAPMDTEESPAPAGTADERTEQPTAAADAAQVAAGDTAAMEGVDGGAMHEALRQAAEAAEVDLAFLEALPEELRVEVLSARGVELTLPQPTAALQQAAAAPAADPNQQPVEAQAAAPEAAAEAAAAEPGAGDTSTAADATGEPAADAPAAASPSGAAQAAPEDEEPSIDPEFLAALPEDIRQEVLAQQAAERRARAAQRAAQQRQQEMGLADLLAAMDDDARADALGQLNDSDLAQLPPAMRAQAQALRERVARQQQALQQQQAAVAAQQQQHHDLMMRRGQLGAGALGGLVPGNRLLIPLGQDGLPLPGSRYGPLTAAFAGRAGAAGAAVRADLLDAADKAAEEPEGPPLLEEADLAVLIQLLRASLPLSKVHLQKLLLNLAGHSVTREQLLKKLLGLLRSLPGASASDDATLDSSEPVGTSSQTAASMDVSDDGSAQPAQQGLTATLDQLGAAVVNPVGRSTSVGAADSNVIVLSPQGKPAIVSRRVLDMLAYLSRHSSQVSMQMLQLRIPAAQQDDKGKGKQPALAAETAGAPRAVEVLLAMLSAPLCQRSISLLEQLALLLEVVLSIVQRHEADRAALAAMKEARRKEREQEKKRQQDQQQQATQQEQQQPQPAAAAAGGQQSEQQLPQQPADTGQQVAASTEQPATSTPFQQDSKPDALQQQPQHAPPSELTSTLVSIQPSLLQQLPGLLAREALSESAYISIAKVIKLIVESAPVHLPLMLSVLVDGVAGVANGLLALLDTAAEKGIDADAQLAPAIGTKSGVVLRMLYALQGFQAEVKERVKQQEQHKQQDDSGTVSGAAVDGQAGSSQPPTEGPGSSRGTAAAGTAAAAGGSSSAAGSVSSLDPVAASIEVDKAVAAVASRTAPLWKALSSCILRVEDNLRAVLPQQAHAAGESAGHAAARLLPPGAQQVLPLVEAFFVLCALQGAIPAAPSAAKDLLSAPSADVNMLGRSPSAAAASGGGSNRAATPAPAAAPGSSHLMRAGSVALDAASSDGTMAFLRFAERHRRLLNAYIRRNTSLLESSLAPLLRVPKLIDFDNKRAYFKTKVRAQDERAYAGGLRLAVKRSTVFEDSFNKLRSRTPAEMRGKLSVSFIGEEGIDAGGVSREWYQVMAREIFNPNLALFVNVPDGGTTFQPNPNSVVQSDTGVSHLEFFKFVGRLVGKALYDGQLMDAYFTRSFYKHMLGQPLTYEDIEAVDPEYYKNLKWMLENDITDVLDLTFTAESDFFGKTEIVELVPGGREVKVTEANKPEYVNLIARHRMTTSIKAQIQAFLEGFWQLVPRELISIFNDHELELLISGLPDIDVADLRANTEYTGYTAASPVIQWFWQVVAEMDKQDLALLLQFVTGTSKVPLNGFKALQGISGPQRFQIHKSYGTDRLPSAHTCFNQLDLPEYESKEQLAERLAMAIHEGHEGFGFG